VVVLVNLEVLDSMEGLRWNERRDVFGRLAAKAVRSVDDSDMTEYEIVRRLE
jgi:hypothetical protein